MAVSLDAGTEIAEESSDEFLEDLRVFIGNLPARQAIQAGRLHTDRPASSPGFDCQPVSLSGEQIARRREISLGKRPVDVTSGGCGDVSVRADGSPSVGRSDVVLPSSLPPRFLADGMLSNLCLQDFLLTVCFPIVSTC